MDELNAKEIRFFNLGAHFMGRYNALRKRLREERLGLWAKRSAGDFLTMIGGTLAVFGCLQLPRLPRGKWPVHVRRSGYVFGGLSARREGVLRNIITGAMALYENNLFLSSFLRISRI